MILLFDIGGTKMRFAFWDGKTVKNVKILPTPQRFDDALAKIKEYIGDEVPEGIMGGLPGILDLQRLSLLRSPNLPLWVGESLADELGKLTEGKIFLENDAALAGLGEVYYGTEINSSIVAYISLGTGVGGVRIVDRMIDKKALAFEVGHQIVEPKGLICGPGCQGMGHWEAYVSGSGIERRYGSKPEEIKDPHIWEEVEYYLGLGLHNLVVHWSPHLILIGGALMRSPFLSLGRIKDHLEKKSRSIFPELPEIKKASLGEESGLWGAGAYWKIKANV